MERVLLNKLQWDLRPVTPYELMRHLVLYANLDDQCLKDRILYHAQVVIDFALCGESHLHCFWCIILWRIVISHIFCWMLSSLIEYALLKYKPSLFALGSILCAFAILEECPQRWARAMKTLGFEVFEPKIKKIQREVTAEFPFYERGIFYLRVYRYRQFLIYIARSILLTCGNIRLPPLARLLMQRHLQKSPISKNYLFRRLRPQKKNARSMTIHHPLR